MMDFTEILRNFGNKNCADIRSEWNGHEVDGESRVQCAASHNDVKDVLRYEAWGQKAWLLEHGSGKKMDDATVNPDLIDYKNYYKYWNPERETTEIRTRPRNPVYYDLDDNPHHGSGKGMPHGFDVEESGWHFHDNYHSIEPLHIIRGIVMGDTALNRMMEEAILDEVGKAFDRAIGGEGS